MIISFVSKQKIIDVSRLESLEVVPGQCFHINESNLIFQRFSAVLN